MDLAIMDCIATRIPIEKAGSWLCLFVPVDLFLFFEMDIIFSCSTPPARPPEFFYIYFALIFEK
jgi:hypothetical protein